MCERNMQKKEKEYYSYNYNSYNNDYSYNHHMNSISNVLRYFNTLILVFVLLTITTFVLPCFSFKVFNEKSRFICDNLLLNEPNNSYFNKREYCFRKKWGFSKSDILFKRKLFVSSNKKFKVMSAKVDSIIESLKVLTLLEASELVKKIETTFSVDTTQHVEVAKADKENENESSVNDADNEDENRVYDLILESVEPNKKIPIIKIVKEIKKDLNLKQAKDLVDNLPQTLFEKINKETADQWKQKLTEAGGNVKLK